ncbi:MAG: Holliday junction ATP-dependent helicase RuvA [Bacillota bacterium]|jgi:Holliday junction DNA helicase RuvA
MIYSLTGLVVKLQSDHLVIEVQGVGYFVYITKPESFQLNEINHVYTYHVIREGDQFLVGFAKLLEKRIFEQLLSVKGIGPKTAIGALSGASPDQIIQGINEGNVAFLKSLPSIGPKAASQIILDLKGKITFDTPKVSSKEDTRLIEVRDALKSLGFKANEIDRALKDMVVESANTEQLIKIALKRLGK